MLSKISLKLGQRLFGPERVISSLASVSVNQNGEIPVFLTFDDGPDETLTPLLLEQLDRLEAKATFFMIGEKVAANPELARAVRASGHAVGSHSWSHPSIREVPARYWVADMKRGRSAVEDALGESCPLFRAPYGALNPIGLMAMIREGLKVVQWSHDMCDFEDEGGELFARRFDSTNFQPGSILLMHDNHPAASARLVDAVSACEQSLQFKTLDSI